MEGRMAIDERRALPLMSAYPFAVEEGLEQEASTIREMEIEWDRPYTSSLRRGFVVELFIKKGVFDRFKEKHWSSGNSDWGRRETQRYLRIKGWYDAFLAQGGIASAEEPSEEEDQQFAAETDLRDYLAKNPERVEPGLQLYRDGDRAGVEFPVDDGRIDILAMDKAGRHVVVELKVSRGRNKALGQLLYYMGWVDKHLGKGPCRGMIIAKEI